MEALSIVRLFYIMYTVYTLFVMSVSDYKFIHAFFGLAAIWIVYISFHIGYRSFKRTQTTVSLIDNKVKIPIFDISEWRPATYVISTVLCWVCTLVASRFYTGLNVIQVLRALISGESLYASYQKYFAQANLAAFSMSKIIFVLMLTYVTAMLFFSFTSILLSGKKITFTKALFLFFVGASYMFFGISRGTNFEMYVIFILLAYCILNRGNGSRAQTSEKDKAKRRKGILIVGILGVIIVFIFRIVLTVRGSVFRNTICQEINFNSDSFIARIFPAITNIGLSVFSYLGYGIYAIGVTISDIFMGSLSNALAAWTPYGYQMLLEQPLSDTLKETIEVGVRWIPDWVNFVEILGLPLFITFVFILGRMTAKMTNSDLPKLLRDLICIFVFLEMLAIPIGNFIVASTPSVLTIIFVIMCCVYCKLRSGMNKKKESAAPDTV